MSSSSNTKVNATPTRDRLPFPPTLHPSPNNQKTPSVSTSGTPPTGQSVAPTQSVTVESLLASHAAAPSPPHAALEVAVSERNLLAAQNSQLWKLIEKQRSGYNQILKELERVRGERDGYRAKLQQMNAGSSSVPGSGRKDKEKLKQSSLPSSTSNGSPPSESGLSNLSSSTSEHPRQNMTRHYSDEQQTPRATHHTIHSSRSQEPLHPRDREAPSNPAPSALSSAPLDRPSASAPTPSLSHHSSKSSISSSPFDQKANVNRIVIPSRTESLPPSLSYTEALRRQTESSPNSGPSGQSSNGPSPSGPQPASTRPLVVRKSSMPESGPGMTINLVQSPDSVAPNTIPPPFSSSSPSAPSHLRVHPTLSQSPSQLQPVTEDNASRDISRDSRISLPDEAKQYIVNMGESPLPSPKVAQNFAQKDSEAQNTSLGQSIGPAEVHQAASYLNLAVPNDTKSGSSSQGRDNAHNQSRPLLPTGQSQTLKNGPPPPSSDISHDRAPRGSLPIPPMQQGSMDTRRDPGQDADNDERSRQQANQVMHSRDPASAQQAAMARTRGEPRTAADDFPLPPSSPPAHTASQSHLPLQMGGSSQAQGQQQPPQMHIAQGYPQPLQRAPPPPEGQQLTYGSPSGSSVFQSMDHLLGSEQELSQFPDQPQSVPASFRALPLLPKDLPHTRIQVSHSSIRPNDRGKDVLSFIIVVDPGQGKEQWRIEKLYSDVLGLDSRIRAGVGKGVGKKIASLPEGKLWKDHAPAKVDQRKAALENYLQTLINLPVKNKDEVIAFFTSDILREAKQPVSQAGYKEGYLTKRGKNFGGWKTRYFVLQGPVLEYYESRGGTHLGSIVITGAQIGRQQKSGDKVQGDEEKEYRHAFLIVEAKKGPGGNHPRHVLCAESDGDRDSWVEMLVRYVMGAYNDEPLVSFPNSSSASQQAGMLAPRSSTSSLQPQESSPGRRAGGRGQSREELRPSTTPTRDTSNPRSYHGADDLRSSSPTKQMEQSPIERTNGQLDAHDGRRQHDRVLQTHGSLPDASPLSSSLPTSSSPLETASYNLVSPAGMRSNSELGHYPDLQDQRQYRRQTRQPSPEKRRTREPQSERKPLHRDVNAVRSSPTRDRDQSPEKSPDGNSKVKISGPINGAPIPAGYKFGSKDAPSETSTTNNDRREKAKSRSFWGFGRPGGSEKMVGNMPRPVFGVPLDEALDVSQICNLPSIVFRCIQYLEAKQAEQEEGIYRLSGSSAVIKSLKDRFNAEGDVDLLGSDEYWDPHAIAGLLKSFLRELPASILTRDLHLKFLAVIDFVDPQERIRELSQLIASLPIANYSLLRALTAHLILIVQNSSTNKMTMRNVGIVFSPTLGIPAGVFSLMLGEFNRVFNVDEDSPGDTKGEASLDGDLALNRRNSKQYSDAAADQILGLSGRKLSAAPEEPQSDTDDFSVTEESGAETTEADALTLNSSNGSSPGSHPDLPQVTINAPTNPPTSKSKASATAANRGLNIAVSDRGNRHSRIMGLPASPRPQQQTHASPGAGQQTPPAAQR